ncbi:MAG: M14 family metallopeptidase [Saprospiraceae bacterium]
MTKFNTILAQYGIQVVVGQKTRGYIQVPGTSVSMPITVISGTQPGQEILITGGVHGGEYPCIETAIRLAKALQPTEVRGTVVVIHPVNPAAFLARLQYYGPFDGKNLNRVFPGKALGTVSERIAFVVHQLQQAADFYLDLHGGDIHEALVPFAIYSHLGEPAVVEQSKQAAVALGFPYVVGSYSDNGSVGAAAKAGTPGFLAELGQCGRWSESEVETYIDAVKNVLYTFEVLEGTVNPNSDVQFMEKMSVLTAEDEGCWYAFQQLEDSVKKGDKIGEIRDFFGQTLSEYFADSDGILIYVVTSLAIMKGDPLAAIGVLG